MKIVKATALYEDWLAAHLPVVENDLHRKHKHMADDVYSFMRATYYRWAQNWLGEDDFRSVNDAPTVLSVGDLHTDNFGSWRDREARLVWGINDFDEAYPLSYTADLVRLVASAYLALDSGFYVFPTEVIGNHVLAGYENGLKQGGAPIVLAEESSWLQELVVSSLKDAGVFWEKLNLPGSTEPLPPDARNAIEKMLPEPGMPYRVSARTAGVGSLGRQRFVALMNFSGANAARETKPLTNSGASLEWLDSDNPQPLNILYNEIVDRAIRSRDPFLREHSGWVVRRLSPDYVRFDLSSLETEKLVGQVLNAMGWETANVHLGDRGAGKSIRKDLKARGTDWLSAAADQMLELVQDDFNDWRDHWRELQDN